MFLHYNNIFATVLYSQTIKSLLFKLLNIYTTIHKLRNYKNINTFIQNLGIKLIKSANKIIT